MKKALLILNPYFNTSYELGQPVLNDGDMMEKYLTKYGYDVSRLVDASSSVVLEAIKKLITTSEEAVIYYSGHGSRGSYSKEESDGRNEAFVFMRRVVLVEDDEMAEVLKLNKTKKLILFNDCCHSGTIWDLEKVEIGPDQVVYNISACKDCQTAAQLAENGALTSIFWPNFSSGSLNYKRFTRALKHFGQAPQISKNKQMLNGDFIEIPF